jgi:CRP-like cAMP-binding protein
MRDSPELRTFLSDIAIFGGLTEQTLGRIIAMLEEQQFPVGATVCNEGEPGRSMYVVGAGEVVVCRRAASGTLVRVVRLGVGDLFGEMALIDVQPRSAAVVVEAAATLYALTNAHLYALYLADRDGYIMVIQNLCRELSRRLRKADAAICERADDAGDEATQIRSAPPWLIEPAR